MLYIYVFSCAIINNVVHSFYMDFLIRADIRHTDQFALVSFRHVRFGRIAEGFYLIYLIQAPCF